MALTWSLGDIIVMRGVLKGKLWWACPAYVVQDTPELLVLYWAVGTPTKSPVQRPSVEDELYNRIQLHDRLWTDNDVLSLNPAGAAFSIEVMWEASNHQLRGWYVHLQEPLRRTAIGVDTIDQMLDIVISPDQTRWYWKDEDELNQAEHIGVYSPVKANAIRSAGQKVIRLLQEHASHFCDGWEDWLHPRGWTAPDFPEGWDNYQLE
jgi:predicted RNA-binding protein associated with RNAse of E/G family